MFNLKERWLYITKIGFHYREKTLTFDLSRTSINCCSNVFIFRISVDFLVQNLPINKENRYYVS